MELLKKYRTAIFVTFIVCMFVKPAICFLILGALSTYFGFTAIRFLKSISKSGIEQTGTIIEYQSDNDGNKTPLIEFTTLTGETIRKKPFVYASTDLSKLRNYKNQIDQPVLILYNQEEPEKFVLKNEEGFNYIVFIFFILIGLFFIGLSICWLSGYIKMDN